MDRRRRRQKAERSRQLDDALGIAESFFQIDEPLQEEAVEPVDWDSLPQCLDPACKEAELCKEGRAYRKRQQLASIAHHARSFLRPSDVCVEFGAGSGHLTLLLAWLFPNNSFIMCERKEYSVAAAKSRIEEIGLKNCSVFLGDVQDFKGNFQLGVSLHSCGLLTDIAMEMCLANEAAFVLCPCCYGQIGVSNKHPRSTFLHDLSLFKVIAAGADWTVPASGWDAAEDQGWRTAKRCMRVVDGDRGRWAAEAAGYVTRVASLSPLSCSPKNNLLIGCPAARRPPPAAATREGSPPSADADAAADPAVADGS